MIEVRLAKPRDALALSRMTREFTGVRVASKAVAAALRRSAEVVAVTAVGDEPAGFACAQVNDSICYLRPWAELSELYVKPGFRRKGVGRKLVAFVERELRRRSVAHIHILTGVRNRGARALYERFGYRTNRGRPEVLYEKDVT